MAEPWPANPHAHGLRRRVGEFTLSTPVQSFIVGVIIVNAITMGLHTSERLVASWGGVLYILEHIALAIFIVELVAKMWALGPRFFRDGWNVFDFLVVAIALVPAAGQFAVLRALRVLRVFRLVNRMPQLRRIAAAIIQAIPGIGAIAALMGIVFYVGSVMATTLFGKDFPEWFGTVGRSCYSLFQIMTLESWSMGIVRPVMEHYPYAWAFFVPFIMSSAFVMLNLFVAVIVDAMSNLSSTEAGTVSDPAPVIDRPEARQINLFDTDHELLLLRQELREIKELLAAQTAERVSSD